MSLPKTTVKKIMRQEIVDLDATKQHATKLEVAKHESSGGETLNTIHECQILKDHLLSISLDRKGDHLLASTSE